MTSADTLGPGTTSNVSTMLPSVSLNSSFPIENNVPRPDKAKVSSIEAGLSGRRPRSPLITLRNRSLIF